ncbi:MAG TPA: hypothetical protein VHZ51_18380 [Ktedonobacteraceae bacterium]|nr:hypothetical protein [Ktedonobacteraceae bacterium]
MRRLLLPFTYGIDTLAIEQALWFAKESRATLVVFSLIVMREKQSRNNVRAEYIQQSKDFLVYVSTRARRAGVAVEPIELYARNSLQSIRALAGEMECAAILLFECKGKGVLLDSVTVKHLFLHADIPLILTCLPARSVRWPLPSWLSRVLARPRMAVCETVQVHNFSSPC